MRIKPETDRAIGLLALNLHELSGIVTASSHRATLQSPFALLMQQFGNENSLHCFSWFFAA